MIINKKRLLKNYYNLKIKFFQKNSYFLNVFLFYSREKFLFINYI